MKFDSSRVAVVDKVGSSLLVRGMDPAVSGVFDGQAILDALTEKGVEVAGKRLIVVSVIDNVGERWAWTPEVVAFGVSPTTFPESQWPPYLHRQWNWCPSAPIGTSQEGELYWWPFEGLPVGGDVTTFLSTPGWNFSGAVDLVDLLAANSSDAIVYFHCMLGADRTGTLHTGYLMKAKGLSLDEAIRIADYATSAGAPNADYVRLREAYAKFLSR